MEQRTTNKFDTITCSLVTADGQRFVLLGKNIHIIALASDETVNHHSLAKATIVDYSLQQGNLTYHWPT